jgi:hypothetical protein
MHSRPSQAFWLKLVVVTRQAVRAKRDHAMLTKSRQHGGPERTWMVVFLNQAHTSIHVAPHFHPTIQCIRIRTEEASFSRTGIVIPSKSTAQLHDQLQLHALKTFPGVLAEACRRHSSSRACKKRSCNAEPNPPLSMNPETHH